MGQHITIRRTPDAATTAPGATGDDAPGNDDTDDALLGELEASFREVLDLTKSALQSAEVTPALLREFTAANRALVGLIAERRQQRKFKQSLLQRISIPLLLDRLRQATPEERAHVAAELEGMDDDGNTGSVLG